jgi:hypothetical protein
MMDRTLRAASSSAASGRAAARVIKAIANNEERKEITPRRHKILTWKTLSNKER